MTRTDPAERPSAAAVAAALGNAEDAPTQALLSGIEAPPILDATRALTVLTATSPTSEAAPTPSRLAPPRVLPGSGRDPKRRYLLLLAAATAALLVIVALTLVRSGTASQAPTVGPTAPGTPGPARLDQDLARLQKLVTS